MMTCASVSVDKHSINQVITLCSPQIYHLGFSTCQLSHLIHMTCQVNKVFLFLSKGLPQIAKPVLAGAWPVSGNALP